MVSVGIHRQLTEAVWLGQTAIYTYTCCEHDGSFAIYVLPQHGIPCVYLTCLSDIKVDMFPCTDRVLYPCMGTYPLLCRTDVGGGGHQDAHDGLDGGAWLSIRYRCALFSRRAALSVVISFLVFRWTFTRRSSQASSCKDPPVQHKRYDEAGFHQ